MFEVSVINLSNKRYGLVDLNNLVDDSVVFCCDVECRDNLCNLCVLKDTRSLSSEGLPIEQVTIKSIWFE